jgi:uncharacterized alpha/beta hydrolase family protein
MLPFRHYVFLITYPGWLFLKTWSNSTLPVYIDTKDEFSLSGKITNDKETPIIITGEELRRF